MNNSYYLLRHGESTANKQGIIACKPSTSCSGYGLTEKGVQQATTTATWLKEHLTEPVLVYASDYLRAKQTARIVAEKLGVNVIEDTRLRERDFGALDGESDTLYGSVWAYDASPKERTLGAESLEQLTKRVMGLIHEIEQQYRGYSIVLASHGDPLVALQSYVLHNEVIPGGGHPFQNAEVRKLDEPSTLIAP
jgi:probable phosphoglycerate mutase